ncbi:MAG: C_GCAxxG_C_C family protein [Alistipes sp.]|nr:C_GCAxxG_C_C family protein [Candidatus Minthomonas equi]
MNRSECAYELFRSGYNCCQSVVLAFSDYIAAKGGPDESTLAMICSGFGGGMGRMREVCGTVSGMTILAGFIIPAVDVDDRAAKTANYELVRHFAERFRELNGSIVCRELLGLTPLMKESAAPSPRTPGYYEKRPCGELCRIAASIVEQYLNENKENK